MNNFNYKMLTPFKWYVLENFPFIEADFDALTEWQLFCKLGKELNKIINSTNTLGTQVENLTSFVSNYFKNLDVQEEINNKLNDMAESGELEVIIASFLNTNAILSFNTIADMLASENIIEGSTCRTLGLNTFNDGKGRFYKIEKIISANENEVDGINLINIGHDDLYARLIIENYINVIEEINNILPTKIQYYNNIEELKNSNLENGSCILLGYYQKGDNIPITYNIVDTGVDNSGSVIALNNGKFAHAILNDEVTPETFGISENDTKEESIEKWSKYMQFVNSNKNLSFKLLGKTYTIYTPIIVGANFKGMGRNRTIIKAGDTIPSITADVKGNQVTRSCLLYYSNTNIIAQQTKTELFTLDCDNKCECGIFLSNGAYWNTENIEIKNSTYAGIYTVTAWQCNWKQIAIDHTQNMGVVCGGISDLGLTTQTFENISCNGNNTAVRAFYGVRLYYSRFINCSADKYTVNAYRFENCKNIGGNLGCEYITGSYIFFFNGCDCDFDLYATQVTPTTDLIASSGSNSLKLNLFFWNSTINKLIELGTGQNVIDLMVNGNITNNNILTGNNLTETLVLLKRSNGFYKAKNSLNFTEI